MVGRNFIKGRFLYGKDEERDNVGSFEMEKMRELYGGRWGKGYSIGLRDNREVDEIIR